MESDLEAQPLGALGVPALDELRVGQTIGVAERQVERLVDERPLVVGAQVFDAGGPGDRIAAWVDPPRVALRIA